MHRTEGCWDGCSAALMAAHVINMEKRGLTVIPLVREVKALKRLRLTGARVEYDSQQLSTA